MPEIVILDAGGHEHIFPAGFDPKRAAEVVRKQTTAPSNTGMSTEQLQAANLKDRPDLPSASGFAQNVLSSTGNFIKDAVTGLPQLGKMAAGAVRASVDPQYRTQQATAIGEALPRILSIGGQALKNRYGGVDQALSTMYHDPAGVAADVSTVAGGAGLLAKAGGAQKIARVLGAVGDATNPLSVVGALAEPAARGTARTIIKATVRPPAAVRADFGGSKGVADAILENRVTSEANASKKLGRSVSQADQMIADAEARGVPGVPSADVAKAVIGEPQQTTRLRSRLGVPDESQNLADTAAAITARNPAQIPLTDAQAMKREAQTLAYEAGVDNQSVKKAAEIAKAKALRSGIEARVPEVGPVNERSQQLIAAQRAMEAAQDRPRTLTNFLSLLGGGAGYAGLGPVGGVAIPLAMKALDSPRSGAALGIGVNSIGQGLNANSLRQAALISRLLGESQ